MQTTKRATVSIKVGNGYFAFLGLTLVIFKLGHIQPFVDWSWWLVTMPWWIGFAILLLPFALLFVAAVGGVLVIGIGHLHDKYKYWRRRRVLKNNPTNSQYGRSQYGRSQYGRSQY